MLKTYKSTDNTQLTTHFNVREFRCKCGGNHDTKLDSDLADKLEKLHKALNCSKIIINSGYRCAVHDKNVGGSGTGQHVCGTAADIANIDSTYTATHVDVRSSNFWKGDEVKTTAYSITNDFYKYYGLSESDVYPASAKKSKKFTITVDGVTYSGTLTEK